MRKIFIVGGPTATGKSSYSIKLAQKYNAVIINADSRQVYKELPIITAQPHIDNQYTLKNGKIGNLEIPIYTIEGIDHLLYSYKSVTDQYNIYIYNKDLHTIIESENYKDRNIILTGGSGLYIDSFVYRYSRIYKDKKENNYNYDQHSIEQLQEILGNRISKLNHSDQNNKRRLITRIKQFSISKIPFNKKIYEYYILLPNINIIENNIKKRIEKMKEIGIIEEAKTVYDSYKNNNYSALNIIGYKEFNPYFENKCNIEEVFNNMYIHTRQYAKRQITWFKRNSDAIILS